MTTTAICPGSFDPPTEGHINIIERGLKLFDKIVVAVAVNSAKKTLLTTEERLELLKEIFKKEPRIEVKSFEKQLLVNYARSEKAVAILRGLRTIQDYEYEFQMALANKKIAPDIETVFMMTESEYSHISSTIIKEIVALGGPAKGMIPAAAEEKLREKFKKRP
jgi:pantetheine-phosphate adenylyltransferase